MTISGAAVRDFDFRGAWTERAAIHGPHTVSGDFRNAKFHWADLSGATLSGPMRNLYVAGNISGSTSTLRHCERSSSRSRS